MSTTDKLKIDESVIIKHAKEILSSFHIDFSHYNTGEVIWDYEIDPVTCEVKFMDKNNTTICLSLIYVDDDGTILQSGTNYGELTL